ncbi:MAG: galactokinase [Bacillota bacterium]
MTYSKLVSEFIRIYGGDGDGIRIFEAPGRINLIGEHIDYNGGHVFPVALDLKNIVVARLNNTNTINMAVTSLPNRVSADLSNLAAYKKLEWGNYQCGVAYMLQKDGYPLTGCDLLYHATVPYGSGLSSSASVEVSTAVCLATLGGAKQLVMEEIALLCQKAENQYVGMNCGIMDQFVSAIGKKDHAIFLNCDTLEYKYVPLDLGDYTIVITNTNAPHKHTESGYAQRRRECEQALALINFNGGNYRHLCDISVQELENFSTFFDNKALYKRARHCVTEEKRTLQALKSLEEGDLTAFGKLLNQANISIRDDYEATGRELDAVFDIATKIGGVLGSRMTGGGFGGCNISIVKKNSVDRFKDIVKEKYTKQIGYEPLFYQSNAGPGAMEVEDW